MSEAFNNTAVKRKRGRPRLEDSMNSIDNDIKLIEEFAARPILYDRSAPNYRNRAIAEVQWRQIAAKTGRSVGFVKERMMQLRNRFSTEKRRVEATDMHSPWKLYDFLTFLLPHVKNRTEMRERDVTSPIPQQAEHSNSSLDALEHAGSSNEDEEHYDTNPYRKKYFNKSSHRRSDKRVPVKGYATQMRPSVIAGVQQSAANNMNMPKIHSVNGSTAEMRNENRNENLNGNMNAGCQNDAAPEKYFRVDVDAETFMNQKQYKNRGTFVAFGNFVAQSLHDIEEYRAMDLISNFTSQLTDALKDGIENSLGSGDNAEPNTLSQSNAINNNNIIDKQ